MYLNLVYNPFFTDIKLSRRDISKLNITFKHMQLKYHHELSQFSKKINKLERHTRHMSTSVQFISYI